MRLTHHEAIFICDRHSGRVLLSRRHVVDLGNGMHIWVCPECAEAWGDKKEPADAHHE